MKILLILEGGEELELLGVTCTWKSGIEWPERKMWGIKKASNKWDRSGVDCIIKDTVGEGAHYEPVFPLIPAIIGIILEIKHNKKGNHGANSIRQWQKVPRRETFEALIA